MLNQLIKGELLGLCNRSVCLKPGANFYNHSTHAHYCRACAELINQYNRKDSMEMFGHDLCTEVIGIVEKGTVEEVLKDVNKMDSDGYDTIYIDTITELDNYYNRGPQSAKSTKIPRNNPCPCHSGKKYKQCCLLNKS